MTLRPQKLLCVACLCGILPAVADDKQSDIDTIVVSASRLESNTSDLAQSVQIITREQIEHRQAANVTELLRQVVGANIIQQGGRGGVTSIVL